MNEKSYVLVDTYDKLLGMTQAAKAADILSFDTETNSLNPRQGKIVGFSISTEIGNGYYLPTYVYNKESDQLEKYFIDCDGTLVETEKIATMFIRDVISKKKLIMHNSSFDCRFVKHCYGVDLTQALYIDTILLVHTVKEDGINGKFALKEIAKAIQQEIGLDVEKAANEEQLELKASIKANGGSVTSSNFEIYKADLNVLAKYAAADTDLTLRICDYYLKILHQEELSNFFFVDEVMPLCKEVTIKMEEKGVKLDMDLICQAKKDIVNTLAEYKTRVLTNILSHEGVRAWVVNEAITAYPPTNKGQFAQELAKMYDLPIEYDSEKEKYNIVKRTIYVMPDSSYKKFLVTGEIDDSIKSNLEKVSMKMWKDANDGYINIQSKLQMGKIVFGVMGFKPLSKTKKGADQFDDDFIQSIADKEQWAKDLRVYNRLVKISSTYIDRFLESSEDGKYYFSYKQHGTISGRYGSDAQQLPRPKDEGDDDPVVIHYNNMVRAFFVPEEGNVFIDDDYTSLEPSVFAHVSGDEGLMEIFKKDYDFYSTIAIKTEGYKDYSPDKKADNYLRKHLPKVRSKAKAYALGIPYGMGAYALGKNLEIPTKEAKKLVDGYLDGFPELKKWMERSNIQVKEHGFIKTQVGRIRHLPKVKKIYETIGDAMLDWEARKMLERIYGENKVTNIKRDYKNGLNNSMNFQIQSLAASIVNRAAIAINREFAKKGIVGWVCAQIHDQLIVEVEESHSKEAAEIVQYCMENTTKLNVPLHAEPVISHNWRDGHA
jgi:DNA polymerase I-like protein with 3'-5' exonuclease and polymerase domains